MDRATAVEGGAGLRRPGKVLFPEAAITKADLVDYYESVAEWILPHWAGRPVTLQRFPDGIGAPGFYQKEASEYFPEWIRRAEVAKEGGVVHHVLCDDVASLAYLAGQACVAFHLWLSRWDRPRRPDRLIFDLDPPASWSSNPGRARLARLRAVAVRLRELLAGELRLECFVMTTGSRGFHVVVPIARRLDFDVVRDFARTVARVLVARDPHGLTLEVRKAKRGDRIFIDVQRNGYAQTAVAPYSVRALPGAPVATPIGWDELDDVEPRSFDLRTLPRRLARGRDPWSSLATSRQALGTARRRVGELL